MKPVKTYMGLLALISILILSGCISHNDYYTRGIGIYPGDPAEDFSPVLKPDYHSYRNIALFRPAYHSSSYDYNLTAQLITDGLLTHGAPDYIKISTNQGEIPKNEREWLLDQNRVTQATLEGNDAWLQLEMEPSDYAGPITRISLDGSMDYNDKLHGIWQFICQGSDDGASWVELSTIKGSGLPGKERPDAFAAFRARANTRGKGNTGRRSSFSTFFAGPYGNDSTAPKPSFTFNFPRPGKQRILNLEFNLEKPVTYKFYRIILKAPEAEKWVFGNWDFWNGENKINMVPSRFFNSAWMSAGTDKEWVAVDLGTKSKFDHIRLYWINKAVQGSIQVSDDDKNWHNIAKLPDNADSTEDFALGRQVEGRFVRVLMTKPANDRPYVLSELEIMGKGGLIPQAKPQPASSGNRMMLDGGNWRIQRSSEVSSSGEEISQPGFRNENWPLATVPGTALVSYWNDGALPDPNFGDNQLMISESFFNSDFWYRDEFTVPSTYKGKNLFLNFDGINWKADIFMNGKNIGRIEGAFIRGKFDVTGLLRPGHKNALAVLIHKNDHIGVVKEQTALSPDKNGGILGADNPTYHASIGWDWIPTIRGRNIGIWNDVYLQTTGAVTLEDPLVLTDLPLPDTTSANLRVEVTLRNHSQKAVSGTLTGKYGNLSFKQKINLQPAETTRIHFDPGNTPVLHLNNPKLWWPNGYGQPYLYHVELSFKFNTGQVSDRITFESGIRKMTYTTDNGILSLYVNGRRFIGRGGNWGFPESNLEYRGREYDAAVAYHADMNFTMIRNWVGQTADDEFFEACDRHGIMVWQDFCLANPADGPDPDNPQMFLQNAEDVIKRIRNHPSIAIYVGRNEGNPPEVIDTSLRAMIGKLHPGLMYIPNSAFGVVSGGGPYRALPVRDYFLLYGYNKLHSERGMPNVMTYESLKRTLPDSALWPQNSLWGMHDYCLEGAQGAASFNGIIEKAFGQAGNAREFTELAQWINYNGYRGMFEGRSLYRKGLLLWMSHPAWPSMVWQTYDYYLAPTAAYFACKKACEPIHIQWNPVFDHVEVVNYNAKNRTGLTARARIYNSDGTLQWEKETKLDCREDSTAVCFKLEFPKTLTPVHFIKLTLSQNGKIISDNFYWRGLENGNYQALKQLPSVPVEFKTHTEKTGDKWVLTTTLINKSKIPALMIRLKVAGKRTGERILPVFYSDNYISLMPGEERILVMRCRDEDTRGEKPVVMISGFNLKE